MVQVSAALMDSIEGCPVCGYGLRQLVWMVDFMYKPIPVEVVIHGKARPGLVFPRVALIERSVHKTSEGCL